MKPQSCKAKGRRLQQQIVADLLERFPTLEDDDIRSTSMGANGEDVQLSPAARVLIPYSFEAKNQERLNAWQAVAQAEANTPAGSQPIVVIKKNGHVAYAVVRWSHFLDLIAAPTSPTAEAEDETSESLKAQLLAAAETLQALAGRLPGELGRLSTAAR